MLTEEDEKKIQRAINCRKQPKGFMKMFKTPDYLESAELFEEVGMSQTEIEQREKYLLEAAETYQMHGGEFGPFKAYKVYTVLADSFEEMENIEKSVEYLTKAANQISKISNYLSAGNLYMKAASMLSKSSPEAAKAAYNSAITEFQQDKSCVFHTKKALSSLLELQLDSADYVGASETLSRLDVKYSQLCRSLLGVVLNKPVYDLLDSKEESDLYLALLNKHPEDAIQTLDAFVDENPLPDFTKKILQVVRQRLLPENDIC